MRFHEFCLFVCTTPALGIVALKLEKDFDDRFLLYYFLSLSLSIAPSPSALLLSVSVSLTSYFLSLSLFSFSLSHLLSSSFLFSLSSPPQVFRILLCREVYVASVLSFFPYAICYFSLMKLISLSLSLSLSL